MTTQLQLINIIILLSIPLWACSRVDCTVTFTAHYLTRTEMKTQHTCIQAVISAVALTLQLQNMAFAFVFPCIVILGWRNPWRLKGRMLSVWSGTTIRSMRLQCKWYFVQRLLGNHQLICPSTSGIVCSWGLLHLKWNTPRQQVEASHSKHVTG